MDLNKQVIILAHGAGSRWENSGTIYPYKQLIPIGGIPNISRTIEMCYQNGISHVYMIAPPVQEFYDVIPMNIPKGSKFSHQCIKEPFGSIIQGIMTLRHLWMGVDTTFLLGDVIFSNRVLNASINKSKDGLVIYHRTGENKFTGKRVGEIFALSLSSSPTIQKLFHDTMLKLLEKRDAKLWDLYYQTLSHENVSRVEFSDCYTDDIDSPQEYEQFYSALEREAIKDVR